MMVMYANYPLNCVNYDYEVKNGAFDGSLWTDAKVSLKEENPLMNIPYVGQGGMKVCQSIACASYIGRKLNMNGLNDDEISGCEQLLNEVLPMLMHDPYYPYSFPSVTYLVYYTLSETTANPVDPVHFPSH